jgi:hypothetical protein
MVMKNVDLFLRQQRLLLRSSLLRESLAQDLQAIRTPWIVLGLVEKATSWSRQHSTLSAIACCAWVLLKPTSALKWILRVDGWWGRLQHMGHWVMRALQVAGVAHHF